MACIGGVSMVACSKDDDNAVVPPTKTQLLTQKGWKIKDITIPRITDATKDSSVLKTCAADDLLSFGATTYNFSDSTTKCDSALFFYSKGTWQYVQAKDSINLTSTTPAGKFQAWKVVTLNDTLLKVNYTDSSVLTNKVLKTLSFKH